MEQTSYTFEVTGCKGNWTLRRTISNNQGYCEQPKINYHFKRNAIEAGKFWVADKKAQVED
jgi:hypothetical protein